MRIEDKLRKLRFKMQEKQIDAYIINTSDPHNSEYITDRYKVRQWISGFTGSAGTVVVTQDSANLWTDGRYFIQAEKEIGPTEYRLFKEGIDGYPTYERWIYENLQPGSTVGIIGEIYSQESYEKLGDLLRHKNIRIEEKYDLIDEIWLDRPEIPSRKAFLHELQYTGKTSLEKIEEVREKMKELSIDYYLFSSLDDIAWLYNIRGRDVKNSPVLTSYGLITKDQAYIFTNRSKLVEDILKDFEKNCIELKDYQDIFDIVKAFEKGSRIYLDKNNINRLLYSNIPKDLDIISGINFTTTLKACKSEIEIENQKNAYKKDGVALVKFFIWLEDNLDRGITEVDAANKLLEFRQEQVGFIEPSFDTISAYGENAAMMHYRASEAECAKLEKTGLYLLDSGGQYLDGTTDITRTIALGNLTEEERKDYTLTLKSHIKLIDSRFLYGASGHVLDVIARYPMWQEALDYKCGTGHGVGYLLNVHEGPHRISRAENSVALEEGMVTSIEPGVYRSGSHGVRIENIAVVRKDIKTESGQFMKFEPLSFVPIDTKALKLDIMTEKEIGWLNNYHQKVFDTLKDHLEGRELLWLEDKTKNI